MHTTLEITGVFYMNRPMPMMFLVADVFIMFWTITTHLGKQNKTANKVKLSLACCEWFRSFGVTATDVSILWVSIISSLCPIEPTATDVWTPVNFRKQLIYLMEVLHRPCGSTWLSYIGVTNLAVIGRWFAGCGRPRNISLIETNISVPCYM